MSGYAPEFSVHQAAPAGLTLVAVHTGRRVARHSRAVQGEVITANPGEVHDGVPVQGEKRRWRMLYLDAPLLDAGQGKREWTRPVPRDARVAALLAGVACGDDALALEGGLAALLQHAPGTAVTRPQPIGADSGAL